MNHILIAILGGIGLLVVGFGVGWHAKGVSVTAGQVKGVRAENQAIVQSVQAQANELNRLQVTEQAKSIDLASMQQSVRDAHVSVQEQITRAVFVPYAVPTPDGVAGCTDPSGSVEFMRLYDAAAAGDPAAATTAGAG